MDMERRRLVFTVEAAWLETFVLQGQPLSLDYTNSASACDCGRINGNRQVACIFVLLFRMACVLIGNAVTDTLSDCCCSY
jgi:hypothetical protein